MISFGREVVLHWIAVALYLGGFALYANAVLFGHPGRQRLARAAVLAGLVPHGAALALRWIEVGHGPYMLKHEVLSSNAWVAVAALLVLVWRRPGWGAVALVVLPASLLAIGLGLFSNPLMRELPPSLRSVWLVFHITFAKLAAAAFLLSVATSVLMLVRARRVPPRWVERVPVADVLDALTVRLVGFGFIFWTVAVAAGAIWAKQSWGRYWGWDPVETWSLVAWLTYGTFLHARLFFRMRARPTALSALASFAIFVLTILILPFLVPSMHSAYFQ